MIKLGFCFSKNYRKANINHMMSSISRIQLIKIWPWLHSNHTFLPCCWSGGKGITSCAEPLPYTVWKNEKKKKTSHVSPPDSLWTPASLLFVSPVWMILPVNLLRLLSPRQLCSLFYSCFPVQFLVTAPSLVV